MGLGDAERAQWREKAIQWLQQELAWYSKTLDNRNDRTHSQVLQRLRHWQTEDDLAGLREPDALHKLPPDERRDFAQLWSEVAAVIRRTETQR